MCIVLLTNRKLPEYLCTVIETCMTSFRPEKCPVKTRGVAECFVASQMFLSHYRITKAIFHLFYKITKVFSSFRDVSRVSTLRENEARAIRACVGRVLFYNVT